MPKKTVQKIIRNATEDATEFEKRALDGTDVEQSSEDEAPEEVSAAAAAALAGHRKKAEQQARRTAAASSKSKRKRSRSSKGGSENTENSNGGTGGATQADAEAGGSTEGLELPSGLLAEVKSEGLKRMEDEAASITRSQEAGEGTKPALKGGRSVRARKSSDIQRSDNFQLVVLGKDDSGAGEGADSKAQAAESAQNFLRMRTARHKRVNHNVFKARQRLGPSPNF